MAAKLTIKGELFLLIAKPRGHAIDLIARRLPPGTGDVRKTERAERFDITGPHLQTKAKPTTSSLYRSGLGIWIVAQAETST
jgi:hypothetical protein